MFMLISISTLKGFFGTQSLLLFGWNLYSQTKINKWLDKCSLPLFPNKWLDKLQFIKKQNWIQQLKK